MEFTETQKLPNTASCTDIPRQSAQIEFRKRYYPDISDALWNDWRWQLACSSQDGSLHLKALDLENIGTKESGGFDHSLPLQITPYYAGVLFAHQDTPELFKTVVPSSLESIIRPEEMDDPLAEDMHRPLPCIIHRYPDRVLFLTTRQCAVACRYCTRSRLISVGGRTGLSSQDYDDAIEYITARPQIRDILLSGGDPLVLSDTRLEKLLYRLRRIPHIEIIRIGTKSPAVLPQRITDSLTSMLKKYHPLWMSIHVTHPHELTHEFKEACGRLADAGIPLMSQTVLLKGVNDSVDTLRQLFTGLLTCRVKPYYLYQCDPIKGSGHFRTPVERGMDIMRGLQGHISGYAIPHFIIDAPGGGGKIPLLPDYCIGHESDGIILSNYEGRLFTYPDKP